MIGDSRWNSRLRRYRNEQASNDARDSYNSELGFYSDVAYFSDGNNSNVGNNSQGVCGIDFGHGDYDVSNNSDTKYRPGSCSETEERGYGHDGYISNNLDAGCENEGGCSVGGFTEGNLQGDY